MENQSPKKMNKFQKYFIPFIFSFWTLHADFCQDISSDLAYILQHTEGVSGKFDRVIPFPDQGGSFIN